MTTQSQHGLGVGVVGCGTIGKFRARLAALHPAVGLVAACDVVEERLRELGEHVQLDLATTSYGEVINDPRVDSVVVATSEGDHFDPALAAIEAGKPVLVEKPFVLSMEEARTLLERARKRDVPLYVGYTQRFRRRYVGAREHIEQGYLGELRTATGSIYVTAAVGEAVMRRAPGTTPVLNTLTYAIDMLLWFFDGRRPATVYAQGSKGTFWERYGVADSTFGVLAFEDGGIANFGTSWELPPRHPAYVASMQWDLFGSDGVLTVDDRHRDVMMVSTAPVPSPYTPDVTMNVALLGSAMPGDWALGQFSGPMKDETFEFLDVVASRRPSRILAGGAHAYRVLGVTLAIDEAARTGAVVDVSSVFPGGQLEPAWSGGRAPRQVT